MEQRHGALADFAEQHALPALIEALRQQAAAAVARANAAVKAQLDFDEAPGRGRPAGPIPEPPAPVWNRPPPTPPARRRPYTAGPAQLRRS